MKKRGLGRGLDALLGSIGPMPNDHASVETAVINHEYRRLPVDLIQRGKFQPRLDINPESLEELASSIRSQGVVQPIVVRSIGVNRYEIVAGERRWRAAQLAGLNEIPAIVRDIPDEAAVAIALIENIQREELNPLEEALALNRLIHEFTMTHQQVADAVGRSRTAVTNLLRLIELNEEVKQLLKNGDLEMGHARALLGLHGKIQNDAAQTIVQRGMSVRETERLVRRLQQEVVAIPEVTAQLDPNIKRLQQDLSERLGAIVSIHHSTKGRGKLVVTYNSLDELEGIITHIK